jgi:hypothetical protein
MGYNPSTLKGDLSNLTSPTAANEDIDPASADVESLGTHTNPWLNAYLNFLKDSSNVTTADLFNRILYDASGVSSVNFSSTSNILLNKSINFTSAGTFNVGSVGQPAASYFGIGYYMYDNFGDQIGYMAFVSPNSINLAATFPGINPSFTAGTLNLLTANSSQMPTGAINITVGSAQATTNSGGNVIITAGGQTNASATSGNGGTVNIFGGSVAAGALSAGSVNMQAGTSPTPANSGSFGLFDGNGLASVQGSPGSGVLIIDETGVQAAAFSSSDRELDDSSGATSIYFDGRLLVDASGNDSLDWQNRHLLNSASTAVADWSGSNYFSISYPLLINTGAGTRSPAPTIQAAAGTGVNAYFQRGGICSDNGGLLQLGTGSGATSGEQGRVVFSSLNGTSCAVTISPADAITASRMVSNQIYVTVSSTYFSINFGVAGSNGNEYQFQYTCVGTS